MIMALVTGIYHNRQCCPDCEWFNKVSPMNPLGYRDICPRCGADVVIKSGRLESEEVITKTWFGLSTKTDFIPKRFIRKDNE